MNIETILTHLGAFYAGVLVASVFATSARADELAAENEAGRRRGVIQASGLSPREFRRVLEEGATTDPSPEAHTHPPRRTP